MQTSFTDLVGTAVVPAHCFDSDELTDLTPAFDTETAADGIGVQAGEAASTSCSWCPHTSATDLVAEVSEIAVSSPTMSPCCAVRCPDQFLLLSASERLN